MDFLKKLFGTGDTQQQPDIRFGRYSDIYKTSIQEAAHKKAENAFEEGQYLDAVQYFLAYLRDEEQDNVHWQEREGHLEFDLIQGSRHIYGKVSKEKFHAYTPIARANVNNVGFLRKLIEQNYNLKYSRYALDTDNTITMITDSYLIDASPMKIYQSLRELAILSDRLDDLLLDEFKNLEAVGENTYQEVSEEEKAVKYAYFMESIQSAIALLEKGNPRTDTYAGGYAFMFLALIFKLDYLLRPEGYIMEELALMYAQYFAKDNKNTERKVIDLKKGFEALALRSRADFDKEIYRTNSTFGFTKAIDHNAVIREIDNVIGSMTWYRDNKHYDLALALPSYIVGYCMYNFALPKPDLQYFHLFYQIFESDFFEKLGFDLDLRREGKLNKKRIIRAIRSIAKQNQAEYANLKPDIRALDFSNEVRFAKSYLDMIKDLNLDKTD